MPVQVLSMILLLLVSLLDTSHQTDGDLAPRQCEILSQFVQEKGSGAISIIVGPKQQFPDDYVTPTASSALDLPRNVWSCFSSREWLKVYMLDMRNQRCSLACAEGFVRCSFPVLREVCWGTEKLSASVCAVLGQAHWPSLDKLELSYHGLWNALGLSELMQASWPSLTFLDLTDNNLDPMAVIALSRSSCCKQLRVLYLSDNILGEEGVRALGLGRWESLLSCALSRCSIGSCAAVMCLAQVHFPKLDSLCLTGNRFEVGAIACLSGAQWPHLTGVSLGLQDIHESDCDILGVCKPHSSNVLTRYLKTASDFILSPPRPVSRTSVLSGVRKGPLFLDHPCPVLPSVGLIIFE